MTGRYAENTTVPVEQTQQEIQRLVLKYGADSYVAGFEGDRHMVQFRLYERFVRFVLRAPSLTDHSITHYPGGKYRPAHQHKSALDAEIRRRWRVLLLVIKSKLELMTSSLFDEPEEEVFEREFLSYILIPDGRTFIDYARPQLRAAYERGVVPGLLPGLSGRDLPALVDGRNEEL